MQNSSAKVHSQASKRSSQQWRETQSMPSHGTEPSLQMQQNLKMLKCWFLLWRQWQKRIAVCRLLQQCSTSQLECLATALEPVLHLDFANSLSPLGAALHQEGSQTFYVQRAFRQPLQAVEAEKERLAVKTRGNLTLPNPTTISLEDEEGKTSTIFVPGVPIIHSHHKMSVSSEAKYSQKRQGETADVPPIQRKLDSVPDIRSTTAVLQRARHDGDHGTGRQRKTKPVAKLGGKKDKKRSAEEYKKQLALMSVWSQESLSSNIHLLVKVVKWCDKDLLSYLVQCLYQRLQQSIGMHCLTDHLLLKVFSYLDAMSLCRCSQVCRRWHYLCSLEILWKAQCRLLGERERLGNLVEAVEAVHNNSGEKRMIDWKQAYKDLHKLTGKIKAILLQYVAAAAAVAAQTSDSIDEQPSSPTLLTSAQLRACLTLREMLQLVRGGSAMSTHEVLRSAPESAAAGRWRERAQRRAQNKALESRQSLNPLIEGETRIGLTRMQSMDLPSSAEPAQKLECKKAPIVLLEVAVDTRPAVPSLPNPDGVKCLVLAGYLSSGERPSPGKAEPIPRLKRLQSLESAVLCLQCDERKIVAGMADRMIRVYDIRSGRLVSTLAGHKGSVQCLQFDDYKIVSGSWDTTCIVWDLVHFNALRILAGHTDCVSCLKFHGSTLVTGSYDMSLRVWETGNWSCTKMIYAAHKGPITCVAFNGIVFASGSEDKTVKMWILDGGYCLATLEHTSRVTCLCLSQLCLVAATGDGTVTLWSCLNQSSAQQDEALMQWLPDYNTSQPTITSMNIDRGKVFIAGSDSIVQEWDIATGSCVRTLEAHTAPVTAVCAGHHRIVSAAEDETICVWLTKNAATATTNTPTTMEENQEIDNLYTDMPIRTVTTSS